MKSALRNAALLARQSLASVPEDARRAAQNFLDAFPPGDRVVAAYWPGQHEFDTRPLIGRLLDNGAVVCLPCIDKNSRLLRFVRWDGKRALTAGRFGIAEPPASDDAFLSPDLVVVPLLAFDRHGRRLGYGGGYYDATLAALRAEREVTAIGFAHTQQGLAEDIPAEPHDIDLDWIVTPDGARRFTQDNKP